MENIKKYLVEGLGTMALTLVVALSIISNFSVATPILAAIVLGLFVYSVGHISGTHINPAVTIGLWSIKKIETKEAGKYIGAQFIGAIVAMLFITYTIGIPTRLMVADSLIIGIAEMLGTFFFAFGIASVVYGRTPSLLSGIVIGASLLLGIAIAGTLGSNGVLNPAVALGIKSFGFMYVAGPILGSILGMKAYQYVSE